MKVWKAALFLAAGCAAFSVRAETPLLQDGKKTIFQRVVSHPEAALYSDAKTAKKINTPRTFTSFYVFERKPDALRVGVSTQKSDGWIKASEATDWPQAITMVFTDQMGRDPVLFFKDHESMVEACEKPDIGSYLKSLIEKQASSSRLPADFPVLASEPMGEKGQVAKNKFYLLPVLNVDTQFKDTGTQLLEVASIRVPDAKGEAKVTGKLQDPKVKDIRNLKTGLAFVIDTTISMKPYIDATAEIIRTLFSELQKSGAKDNYEIAVVAFRNSKEKTPGIEYTTKIISDFASVKDREALEKLLSEVKESPVSTHSFDEDSLGGVKAAVDKLNWDKFDSKVILMVTDAGPLGADDEASSTKMSPLALSDYLKTNGIYLISAHIKSPKGKDDHPYAEESYKELSRLSNGKSSYIPIDAASPKIGARSFKEAGTVLAQAYKDLVELTLEGKLAQAPDQEGLPKNATPAQRAKHIADMTGYAMQLQFLGNQKDTDAPEVVRAWVADVDLEHRDKFQKEAPIPAVEPAVLLTKTQLSQLRKQLKLIIETAEEAFYRDSENFNFYDQLVSAAAQTARDPDQFAKDPKANLAAEGILPEVLEGLPYKSRILGLQKDDWANMSTGQQKNFMKHLKGLVARYEAFDKDNRNWEGFGSPNPNEWVYRVPLRVLP